ncbi:MAG: hypothetical protein AAB227_05380 [Pseudomonadota bacterium]
MSAILAIALLYGEIAGASVSDFARPFSDEALTKVERLEFTGETAECINNDGGGNSMRIKQTTALDDFHILFEMEDGSFFISEITGKKGCPGGVKYGIGVQRKAARAKRKGICAGDKGIVYRTSHGNDVFSTTTLPFSICKIGDFHRAVEKSADDLRVDD